MNIFDDIILRKLDNDSSLIEKRLKKAMYKIDRFDLQVSVAKVDNKYKRYNKLYNKMLSVQSRMLIAERDLSNEFDNVDESVDVIVGINNIKKHLIDGDSVIDTNHRLAKKSYDKALEISERLLGISIIDKEDVDKIKDKIIFTESLYNIELIKDLIIKSIDYMSGGFDKLDSIIENLEKVNFSKMDKRDMVYLNKLISKVLTKDPIKLGNLINSINNNPTNGNRFEIKLS